MYKALVYFDDMYTRSNGGKDATLDAKRYIVLSELYSITKYFYEKTYETEELLKEEFWEQIDAFIYNTFEYGTKLLSTECSEAKKVEILYYVNERAYVITVNILIGKD